MAIADEELAKAKNAKIDADNNAIKAENDLAAAQKRVDKAEQIVENVADRTFADDLWGKNYVSAVGANAINDYRDDKEKKKEEETRKQQEEEAQKQQEEAMNKYTNYGGF